MEQEKYLSEEKYQETNKKVKKTSKNDITPTVADAAGTIAKSVSQGFEEGKKEPDDTQNKVD